MPHQSNTFFLQTSPLQNNLVSKSQACHSIHHIALAMWNSHAYIRQPSLSPYLSPLPLSLSLLLFHSLTLTHSFLMWIISKYQRFDSSLTMRIVFMLYCLTVQKMTSNIHWTERWMASPMTVQLGLSDCVFSLSTFVCFPIMLVNTVWCIN